MVLIVFVGAKRLAPSKANPGYGQLFLDLIAFLLCSTAQKHVNALQFFLTLCWIHVSENR